jgi:hypothetical protein
MRPNEGQEIYHHTAGRISQAHYRFFDDGGLIFRLPVRNILPGGLIFRLPVLHRHISVAALRRIWTASIFTEFRMSLQLVVLTGPDKGKTFTLNTGRDLMLGRSANAQYQLGDPRVSRNHCQILLQGDDIVVRCNGGSGGTIVNGKKIQEHHLKAGDLLQVGETLRETAPSSVRKSRKVQCGQHIPSNWYKRLGRPAVLVSEYSIKRWLSSAVRTSSWSRSLQGCLRLICQ